MNDPTDDSAATCAAEGSRGWATFFAALAVGHVVATRLAWSDIPLQTDTGMWAYIGRRILDGCVMYRDLWESKPPGIYYLFALVEWIFNAERDGPLRWLDAVVTLAVLAVTYGVSRRFAGRTASAAATFLLSLVFCHRVLADWGNNVEKFVALFEMLACACILFMAHSPRRRLLCAGLCCGLAGLFKQTGAIFLLVALGYMLLSGRRPRPEQVEHPPATTASARSGRTRDAAILLLGVVLVWAPVLLYLLSTRALRGFWEQAVLYDLTRVAAADMEAGRITTESHWHEVIRPARLCLVLFGPAGLGAILRLQDRLDLRRKMEPADGPIGLVLIYWLAASAVFPVAPYGYGHYLLQAAPAAAVMAAWFFERSLRREKRWAWAALGTVTLALGLLRLGDHFRFTFDPDYVYRQSYEARAKRLWAVVEEARHVPAGRSVMLWPPDYAASYYAGRTTPLEISNADVIFKGKFYRLRPPIDELLAAIRRRPPDVIIDTTTVRILPAPQGTEPPRVFVEAVSLLDRPDEQHPKPEARLLAPLKRWVRDHYGGQQRAGPCTIYHRGRAWHDWESFLGGP